MIVRIFMIVFASLIFSTGSNAADPVTSWDKILKADKSPENWLTHHGTLDGQRFSGLSNINKKNVKNLKVAFTRVIGGIEGGGIWDHAGLEGTPIVEDGMMYVTDGWGSIYKFDVRQNGKLVWKMNPEPDKDFAGAITCCGIDNRGVALWNDKVVSHAIDGRLIVTNKATGEIEQDVQLADPGVSEVITAAAFVVKDSAITGVSGAEYGIRGWLNSTDLNSGKQNWRTYTIPAPNEPGGDTWKQGPEDHSKDAYLHGGGSTWVVGSYDPDLNVIYWGVGNPGPDWDNEYRPGDNLYSNSVLALDADTGAIKWYFQYTPNDPYDFDGVNEQTLVDAEVFGKKTKAVLHADRNGFAYALDRVSGKFLWGTPFVKKLDWTVGLDKYTGRPMDYNADSDVQRYVVSTNASRAQPEGTSCPGNMGGKNWPPTAYDPNRNMYYIPVIESCAMHVNVPQTKEWVAREFWLGGAPKMGPIITGSVTAMDVNTGKVVAKYDMDYPNLSGVLATKGGLVFSAHPDGKIVALDSDNLKELWSFETGTGNNAPPMTFSVDGKQYIAILGGLGGAWPKWFVASTPGLEKVEPGQQLFVFEL
jgi:alcohol dehydrogenase (cytochrome c)